MARSPFGFDKPEDSPGFLLWQTTMVWQRLIKKALEPHDISHAQFVIMATLLWFEEHGQATTQIMIANWTKLDKMTVSKSLAKLAAQRLVHRTENKIDTRAKTVSLTHTGRTLVQTLIPLVEGIDTKFFGIVSTQNQQSLIQILNELLTGIND